MRGVVIATFGDPDGLVPADLPERPPGHGEVLIRTEAIGVGGVDAVIRRGALGSAFPVGTVPGGEVAGQVVGVGDDVDPQWLGRRVWAATGTAGGGYAERAVAPVADAVELPNALSSIDAVALGSAVPVARFGLARAHLAAGEAVLVRGAAGSIGIAAVESAALLGAGAIAVTTSSEERGSRLRALGATHVLDRAGRADGAPASYDVILDVVGGAGVPDFIDRLAPNGRMVSVGVVGGFPPPDFGTALLRGFRRSISYGTLSLDTVPRGDLARARADAFADAAAGRIHAVVQEVLPLESAADAHRAMDAGAVFGRFVLVP